MSDNRDFYEKILDEIIYLLKCHKCLEKKSSYGISIIRKNLKEVLVNANLHEK